MKTFAKLFSALLLLFGVLELSAQNTKVQVIHNSADAALANVDVYVSGILLDVLTNVSYKTASPFIDLSPTPFGIGGDIDVTVVPTGTTPDMNSFSQTVTLTNNQNNIVIAEGIASPTGYTPGNTGASAIALYSFPDGREVAANGAGETDLLIHHGVTDAPAVDIVNVTDGANTVLVPGIAYSEFVGYASLPVDDYSIEVRAAGSSDAVASYIAPLETLNLGGTAITVLASGFLDPSMNSDGEPFGLFAVTAAGGDFLALPTNTLSISDFNQSGVAVYPNPTVSQLNVSIPFAFSTATATAYDISGRQVLNTTLSSGTAARIDMSTLTSGMYIFQLDVNDRILTTKVQVAQK